MKVRVYYEDTDLAGIVYYANYFRFIERGRTEYLRDRGIDQLAIKEVTGLVFAVRRVEADFKRPAKMDDLLDVTTEITERRHASVVMHQEVLRDGELLFAADVTIVCLKASGKPTAFPTRIADKL